MKWRLLSTKKDQTLCIHYKKKVRRTDMLQCYDCKSWVHYECTELPNYTLVSLENSHRRFSCIVLRFQIHFWKR